jgi:hypothetical protein
LASCSKDQKCVNWLEGEWNVTSLKTTDSTGTETDDIAAITGLGGSFSGKMNFDEYSVKNDEYGFAKFTIVASVLGFPINETTEFDYKIQDNCDNIWLREKGTTTAETSAIEEISKTKMTFATYDATEKSTTRITIEK